MNEQLNLFAQSKQEYKIDKPIRLIELFGGIGSQAKALENLGANFERWRLCEWAIPSIKSYAAIHEGWIGETGRWEEATMEDLLKRTNGVSSDYNQPLSEDGRKRLGRKALEELCGAMTRAMTSALTSRRSTLATYQSRKREIGSIATSSPIHFHAKTFPKQGNWLEWKRVAAQGRDCFGK